MCRRTAFIGHRNNLPIDIGQRLKIAIQNEIDLNCKNFIMGTHGEFDEEALRLCKSIRRIYKNIDIEVVITSFNKIKKEILYNDELGREYYTPYSDVKTIMYEIEEIHFKNKITYSNRQMIDDWDTLICYVRPQKYYSGAKTTMNYAKRKGLKIINLYKDEDNFKN